MGTLWVRHAPASATVVRRSVRAALSHAGVSDDEAFDAALIASELLANSIRHAAALPSGQLVVEWNLGPDSYTVAVTDGGGDGTVAIRHAEPWDTSGRGLTIVAALADAWGVMFHDNTTTVWARRTYREPVAARGDTHAVTGMAI